MEASCNYPSESSTVKAAPFTYGRRRLSIFETGADLAIAMRATRSAQRLAGTAREHYHRQHQRHHVYGCLPNRLGGPEVDMATAVRESAKLSCILEGDLPQFAGSAAGKAGDATPTPLAVSLTRGTLSTSFPPLIVDPVPSCLRALRYTRSSRAWDTLASGCLAEATRLSEEDNDVVAWAACFILSGDAQRGMILLESYVVATCVVVHEVLTGKLGRLPKNFNPFSTQKWCDEESGATVRADLASPYLQRKCLKRHNQVLMAWMRCWSTSSERLLAELASYDVNVNRTPEVLVRQVVLQSMQLLDVVEVHRWYIVALMLFIPTDAGERSNGGTASGEGQSRKRRSDARAKEKNGDSTAEDFWTASPTAGRVNNENDLVFSRTRSVHSATSTVAGASKKLAPANDGYHAPQNLWFRYFFALDSPITTTATSRKKNSCDGRGGANNDDDGPVKAVGVDSRAEKASDAVLTSCEAHPQGKDGVHNVNASHFTKDPGGAQATVSDDVHNAFATAPALPTVSATEDETKGNGRESFSALRSNSKLARTLSWFRYRSRNAPSHAACVAAAPFRGSDALLTATAPTWHLPATVSLDQQQTCSLLLSHREEWDVYFITALTAFCTQRYRTCMIMASRFLQWAEANREATGDSDAAGGATPNPRKQSSKKTTTLNCAKSGFTGATASSTSQLFSTVPGLQQYQRHFALFLRAWSALQIGERLQAGKDVIAMLEEKEDSLSYHVGCALGLYGLPLPQAKDTLLTATQRFTIATGKVVDPGAPATTSFSTLIQGYLYLLAEAVHATTLLQLGLVQQALGVAKAALQRAEASGLREENTFPLVELCNVLITAAVAMEDSNAILDVPLSPHRLVYIAVCPAFFGGLCASGIRVKAHSATHRILYPHSIPLYVSTRVLIPFHMNRAMFLYHAGEIASAWDDVCCAVAAVDEIAGSVEFAFSDCFPLRVYHFAMNVGLARLESLLEADLEAAKACLADPNDQKAMEKKDIQLQEDELLSKEIMKICQSIAQRMQHFFPHARVTELCQAQISIVCSGKNYLAQAVALSRRYPHSPSAQNILTLALYYSHHIPEAVDNAQKNLQTFPHSSEVIRLHRVVQEKHITYNFNYRKLLPIPYKPGSHDRIFTKRMIIVLIILVANLVILCLTVYVNVPSVKNMPGGLRYLAVRMQLPTVAPLFFAAVFVIHAIVAAMTTKNLISTLLTDLFFVNTPFNRALFCLRCIPLVNLVDALLVSVLGNNFLFESGSATFLLYFFLSILFVPFTTRIWFLPSVDEPNVGFMSWLAILSVDTVIALFVVIPHVIVAFLEPYMFVLFYFFAPTERPSVDKGFPPPSSSIRRRLLLHAHDSKSMPQRFTTGSGSRFVHIVVLRWLYIWSHCTMKTRFLAESQLEAECYRVFPLVEGEEAKMLYAEVSQAPLCAAITAVEEVAPSGSRASDGGEAQHPQRRPTRAVGQRNSLDTQTRCPEAASSMPQEAAADAQVERAHRRHREKTFLSSYVPATSSSSLLSSSGAGVDSGSSLCSESGTANFSPSGSDADTEHNTEDKKKGHDGPSDGDLDETLLTGVRTVDAMRRLLDCTARDRHERAMRHDASFVRPNTFHILSSVFASHSDGSSGSEDEMEKGDINTEGGAAGEERNGRKGDGMRSAHSAGREIVSDVDNDPQYDSGGDEDVVVTALAFPEDIFGPNMDVQEHVSHHHTSCRDIPPLNSGGAGMQHRWGANTSSSSRSSSEHSSEVASHHADEGFGFSHWRNSTQVREVNEEAATFLLGDDGAHFPNRTAPANENDVYTSDYAAQKGFGRYRYDGASGSVGNHPNQSNHDKGDPCDF